MDNNKDFIKIQNHLSKEFQQWKFKRTQNHEKEIDDLKKSSLFYKFNSNSSLNSPSKSSSIQKDSNKSVFSQSTANGFFTAKVSSSSLKNFKKTIIKDSLINKNHFLNQLSPVQDHNPFVPYFNERDKLGRLVKDEESDVNMNEINIVDQISMMNFQSVDRIKENTQEDEYSSLLTNGGSEQNQQQMMDSQLIFKGTKHKKSFSHIPFGSSSNSSLNQLDKLKGSTTAYLSMNNLTQTNSRNKLNSMLNGGGASLSQISMVQLPDTNTTAKSSMFLHQKSLQQLNLENIENKQQHKNILQPKSSLPSLSGIIQNSSFTSKISYNNSQPCSPVRFITKLNSNNNSIHVDDKIIEFDKNHLLKSSQQDFYKRCETFYNKHMSMRKKSLEKKEEENPLTFKAKPLPLKFPESAKASHACRVLFNHHKKIQQFNKMIDRNDPKLLHFEIDQKEKNTEKFKNVIDGYKKRMSIFTGFNMKSIQQKKEMRLKLKDEKREEILVKWGERVDSSELDDEEDQYKKKILNPILSKEKQVERERQARKKLFDDYEKYYTLQMYYLENQNQII